MITASDPVESLILEYRARIMQGDYAPDLEALVDRFSGSRGLSEADRTDVARRFYAAIRIEVFVSQYLAGLSDRAHAQIKLDSATRGAPRDDVDDHSWIEKLLSDLDISAMRTDCLRAAHDQREHMRSLLIAATRQPDSSSARRALSELVYRWLRPQASELVNHRITTTHTPIQDWVTQFDKHLATFGVMERRTSNLVGEFLSFMRSRFVLNYRSLRRRLTSRRAKAIPDFEFDKSRVTSNDLAIFELEDDFRRAIEALPPDLRPAALLRYGEGMKLKDVARELGQTEDALKHKMERVRDLLEARGVSELSE